jgi:uncharacterized protein YdeI (YjbR/CyaY-like superfamily)
MNPQVDQYLIDGCGRCEHYKTSNCKVLHWTNELKLLREIVLQSELTEEYKWSQPCYTLKGKNVLIVTAFKDYACISFFKGALLNDKHSMLISPGKSSQAAKQLQFTDVQTIIDQNDQIQAYIEQAIQTEKSGKKVEFKKGVEPFPEELIEAFAEDSRLESAFQALTPGRQRSYLLHFNRAKQSKTRVARIEKCRDKIFIGKGFNEY